jgi:hypothetical protein
MQRDPAFVAAPIPSDGSAVDSSYSSPNQLLDRNDFRNARL